MKTSMRSVVIILLCTIFSLFQFSALAGQIILIDSEGNIAENELPRREEYTKNKEIDDDIVQRLQRVAFEYEWVMAQLDAAGNKEERLNALFTVMYLANALQFNEFNQNIVGTGKVTLSDIAYCLSSAGIPFTEEENALNVMEVLYIAVDEYDESTNVLHISLFGLQTCPFGSGYVDIIF